MRAAVLGIRFVCEIAMLVALVWWGWVFAGIGAAITAAVIWGLFIGPRSWNRLPDPYRLIAELIIFGFGTAGFWEVGQEALAIVYAVAAVVTAILVRRWPEPVPAGL